MMDVPRAQCPAASLEGAASGHDWVPFSMARGRRSALFCRGCFAELNASTLVPWRGGLQHAPAE